MIPSRVKNITGERFGEWEVVNYSHTKRSGRSWPAMWICRCSTCGAERVFRGGDLRRRAPRCSKCFEAKYDIAGRQFGHWTVVEKAARPRGAPTGTWWKCRCDCGASKVIVGTALRSGSTAQCAGCRIREQETTPLLHLWNNYRLSAGHRGFEFDITADYGLELLERQGYRCALSGMEIRLARSVRRHQYRAETTASIDRIDSSRGYVPGNVQWVHKDVNRMKWVLSQERFITICQLVSENFKNVH